MGQFEKIVVLSVIGLIAVILVVSFSGTDKPLGGSIAHAAEADLLAQADLHGPLPEGPRPIRGRQEDLAAPQGEAAPAPGSIDLRDPFAGSGRERRPAPAESATTLGRDQFTLSAEVQGTPAETAETIEEEEPPIVDGLPAGAALVTLRGLEDTWEPDLKQYTCRRGDALRLLARRFYGDANLEVLLRQYNEGVELLQENQVLLVPVFDLREPSEVAPSSQAATEPARPAPTGGGGVHVVGEGENLWGIAVDHYGRGTEWQRIFDANRDRLSNANAVRVGMTLRIP